MNQKWVALFTLCILWSMIGLTQTNSSSYDSFREKFLKQPLCGLDSSSLLSNIHLLRKDTVANQFDGNSSYYKDLAVMYHRLYILTESMNDLDHSIDYFKLSVLHNSKDYSGIWNLSVLLISIKKDCSQGMAYLSMLSKKHYRKFATRQQYNALLKLCKT